MKKLNTNMLDSDIKSHAKLQTDAKSMLDQATDKFELSARRYMRTVKVAQAIADLDTSEAITAARVAEALQHRPHKYNGE